jgi:FKBP-type peptidyl-prolyl cis-trans isomerase
VSVQYKGTLLDGKEFDSSAKGNGGKPIEFPLGRGAVIPGWDEGIALLNKGSKATILIPSSLAYGERGSGAAISRQFASALRRGADGHEIGFDRAAPAGTEPAGAAL